MNAADFPPVALTDALERLSSMPAFLEGALEAASHDELVYRPGEGEFSLTEQACHLRDLDREGYLLRARRMLKEDLPTLAPFAGDRAARDRNYIAQDARAAARDFAAARRELVALFAGLGEADLRREAMFEGRRISMLDLIAMVAGHDRGHREEIETLAEALESP